MPEFDLKEFLEIEEKFNNAERKKDSLLDQKKVLEEKVLHNSARAEYAQKAKIVLQIVAQETQSKLEYHLSQLVSTALASVFPEEIEFVARIEIRRGKTECDFLFKEFGQEYNPLEGSGFGPLDVASLALRITFWSLNKNRPVFILDEPFRNVSPDLQLKVSEMLKMLSEKLGLQIIMVSHQEDINVAADKTFLAKKVGKITEIKEV